VEAASAVCCTTTAYCATAVEVARWATTACAASYFMSAEARTATETRASAESWTTAKSWAPAEAAIAESATESVEPRTGADEDAAGEPARAVEAVGCACVRVIIVVAVRANRRTGENWCADAYADYYSLCRSQRCRS
jgi:hypothetical protein